MTGTASESNTAKLLPYFTLDAWRGAASFMVMMYHLERVLALQYSCYALFLVPFRYGNLGVNVFFVISGYCIAAASGASLRKQHSALVFAKARLRRIFPTYWAALALTSLAAVAAEIYLQTGHPIHSDLARLMILNHSPLWYLTNLTLTNVATGATFVVPQAWTLCYEAAFYLVMATLLWLAGQRMGEEAMLWGAHIITGAAVVLLWMHKSIYPLEMWPDFGCGVVVYHWVRFRQKLPVALLSAGLFIFSVSMLFQPAVFSPEGYLCSWCLMLLLIFLQPYDTALSRSQFIRPLLSLGVFSYSLYLTHTLVLGVVSQLLRRFFHPGNAGLSTPTALMVCIFTALPAVFFARIFFQYFERPFLSASGKARIAQELTTAPSTP